MTSIFSPDSPFLQILEAARARGVQDQSQSFSPEFFAASTPTQQGFLFAQNNTPLPVTPAIPIAPAKKEEGEHEFFGGVDAPDEEVGLGVPDMEPTLENIFGLAVNAASVFSPIGMHGLIGRAVDAPPFNSLPNAIGLFGFGDPEPETFDFDKVGFDFEPTDFDDFDFDSLDDASSPGDDVGAGDEAGTDSSDGSGGAGSGADNGSSSADNDDAAGEDPDF